jgi:hypothetical protein
MSPRDLESRGAADRYRTFGIERQISRICNPGISGRSVLLELQIPIICPRGHKSRGALLGQVELQIPFICPRDYKSRGVTSTN